MMLSDADILDLLHDGSIAITPPICAGNLRPFGIRVHLSSHLLLPVGNEVVDPRAGQELLYEESEIPATGFVLEPRGLALGSTIERIQTDRHLACLIDGRSTLARLGLLIHCTAMVMDNIHEEGRSVTLELVNFGPRPVRLYEGLPIGMLLFIELRSPIRQPAQRQYVGQVGTVAPRMAFQPGAPDE